MNKLKMLAAMALLVGAAQAGTVMTLENQAGGEIRLTDMQGHCAAGQRLAYSTHRDGSNTLTGCWVLNEDDAMIFVRWDGSNKLGAFPFKAFNITPYFQRTYGNKQ